MNTQSLKQQRRREIKKILADLSPEERRQQEQFVADLLFQSKQWQRAQTIALTKSMPMEFSLDLIIQQARVEQKQLFVPIVRPKRQMQFVLWEEDTLFQRTAFGVEEPVNATIAKDLAEIDLVIVPGLQYARNGYRLGFGGGYYDRALQQVKGITVSLLYHEQLVEEATWPIEKWDYPIELLITSEGVWKNESMESSKI